MESVADAKIKSGLLASFFCFSEDDNITLEECAVLSADELVNEKSCCEKECSSPERVCPACVGQKIARPDNGDRSVYCSIGGVEPLCEFHLLKGRDANPMKGDELNLDDIISVEDVINEEEGKESPLKESNRFTGMEEVVLIRVDETIPNPNQPRRTFKEKSLKATAKSMKENWQYKPIDVKKVTIPEMPHVKWMICDGERRWRSAKIAGFKYLKAIVKEIESEEILFISSFAANYSPEEMTPLDVAFAIRKMRKEYGYSISAIAAMSGKEASRIYKLLSLTKLSDEVIRLMDYSLPKSKRLNFTVAAKLAEISDEVLQIKSARHILRKGMKTVAAAQYIQMVKIENGLELRFIPKKERRVIERDVADATNSILHLIEMPEERLKELYRNVAEGKYKKFKASLEKLAELALNLEKKV